MNFGGVRQGSVTSLGSGKSLLDMNLRWGCRISETSPPVQRFFLSVIHIHCQINLACALLVKRRISRDGGRQKEKTVPFDH